MPFKHQEQKNKKQKILSFVTMQEYDIIMNTNVFILTHSMLFKHQEKKKILSFVTMARI